MKLTGLAWRCVCIIVSSTIVITAAACQPDGTRPGFSLSGQMAPFPEDWGFSNQHREIAIEVSTPYFIPHSITIWCVEVDGQLFVAAATPNQKLWPGWVADDPNIRLRVGGLIYETRLELLTAQASLERVLDAYRIKYELPERSPDEEPMRIWSVMHRTE